MARTFKRLLKSKESTMKKLFLILFIVGSTSFASGKLQLKPGYYMKAEKIGGQVGLSIWEPIGGGLNFSQWLGAGVQPRKLDDSVFYVVSETALGKWFGYTGVSMGYKFQHADQTVNDLISEHSVFLKLERKLW